jgi:hypothetical protein
LMTVLMHDAVGSLSAPARRAYQSGDLADVVYADDTLLLGASDEHLGEFMRAVADAGKRYGMELHWGKFQLIQVQCQATVLRPDGNQIEAKAGMEYLGTVLTHDGLPGHELGRRIGMAKTDFLVLDKVWKQSSLPWMRKMRIYSSLVETKLLYSLSCLCLSAAERRRLDGFQNRCLRKIVGIKPAYISRVSNAEVLRRTGHQQATVLLQQRQLLLFGKVARAPLSHPLQQASFIPGTMLSATSRYVRRVGRPRREWVPEVSRKALAVVASFNELSRTVQDARIWKQRVQQHFTVHAPPGM